MITYNLRQVTWLRLVIEVLHFSFHQLASDCKLMFSYNCLDACPELLASPSNANGFFVFVLLLLLMVMLLLLALFLFLFLFFMCFGFGLVWLGRVGYM